MSRSKSSAGDPVAARRPLQQSATGALAGHALIVDDHPVNRSVLRGLLERIGVDSTCAASGEEALRVLRGRRFDWILMDLQMPGLDGLAATRRIRGDCLAAGTPILGISAARSARIAACCRAAGMDACIEKPVSLRRLEACLRNRPPTTDPTPGCDSEETGAMRDADWRRCVKLAGDRAEVAEELLYLMLECLPPGIEAIQAAAAAADPEGVARQVHSLLGACRYTGAPRLLMACSELDQLCARHEFGRVLLLLPGLYEAAEHFARAAGNLLAQRAQRLSRTTKAIA